LQVVNFKKSIMKMRKEEHEEQLQVLSGWKSELVSAFHISKYWKNAGLTLLILGAWSALFWLVWSVGVWVIRGFTTEI